jgi:hypothetical protein
MILLRSWDDGKTGLGDERAALAAWETCAKASGFPLCHLSAAHYLRVGGAGAPVHATWTRATLQLAKPIKAAALCCMLCHRVAA